MIAFTNSIKRALQQLIIKVVNDPVILNWSQIHKCILIFFFFLFIKLLWISWNVHTLLTPEFHRFVNLDALRFHLKIEIIELFILLFLIQYFYSNRRQDSAQSFLPYICMMFACTSLVFDSYSSGILATGTIVNSMSFVYLIIILFDKKILFFSFFYSFAIFLFFIQSGLVTGEYQYAPIFNLDNIGYPNFLNPFWLGSTIFFSIPPLVMGIFIFSTILKQWHDRENYIIELSQMDALTGVFNRRVLNEQLVELDKNIHKLVSYSIILLDLDHFKKVNDTYGHIMGDRVLVKTVEILKSSLRSTDILGRYGGEEFLIIIKNTNKEEIFKLAERCRKAMAEQTYLYGDAAVLKVTTSIGIAFVESGMKTMDALHEADLALYQAKSQGRNQICFAKRS